MSKLEEHRLKDAFSKPLHELSRCAEKGASKETAEALMIKKTPQTHQARRTSDFLQLILPCLF